MMRRDAYRLLANGRASSECRGELGGQTERLRGTDGQVSTGPTRGPTRAFMRFLREFRSRNNKALHEHIPGTPLA